MINLINQLRFSNIPIDKISTETNIDIIRLKKIYDGSIDVSMTEVKRFSKVLKVSTDFLLSENDEFEDVNILFRKAINNDKYKKDADIFSYIIGNTFKILEGSDNSINYEFSNVHDANILADSFRTIFFNKDFYSPILNLPSILSEKLKIIIYIMELGKNVDGASAIFNKTPFIFISPRFKPRMLFTLAHELGHILAHHGSGDVAHFDYDINLKRSGNEENFANQFATCLLMPKDGVFKTIEIIHRLLQIPSDSPLGDIVVLYLCRIYGVSFEVAAHRCENLGLLETGGARSLYEYILKEHKSPEIRAQQVGLPDRLDINFPRIPTHLVHKAISKINNGELSIGRASEILSLSVSEIFESNQSLNDNEYYN